MFNYTYFCKFCKHYFPESGLFREKGKERGFSKNFYIAALEISSWLCYIPNAIERGGSAGRV